MKKEITEAKPNECASEEDILRVYARTVKPIVKKGLKRRYIETVDLYDDYRSALPVCVAKVKKVGVYLAKFTPVGYYGKYKVSQMDVLSQLPESVLSEISGYSVKLTNRGVVCGMEVSAHLCTPEFVYGEVSVFAQKDSKKGISEKVVEQPIYYKDEKIPTNEDLMHDAMARDL